MPVSELPTRARPVEHVVTVVEGEQTALFDARAGTYYSLDELGGRIWALLADQTLDQIVDRLLEVYDVRRERLCQDLASLIATLAGWGLVVVS